MGVISNKVNIMELMRSGGGGDPTIPGRVSELELETAGLIEANAKIMSSVAALDLESVALAEGLQHVMTSVSNMRQTLDTKCESRTVIFTNPENDKSYLTSAQGLYNALKNIYDNEMTIGQTMVILKGYLAGRYPYCTNPGIIKKENQNFPAVLTFVYTGLNENETTISYVSLRAATQASDELVKKCTLASGTWSNGTTYFDKTTGSGEARAAIIIYN